MTNDELLKQLDALRKESTVYGNALVESRGDREKRERMIAEGSDVDARAYDLLEAIIRRLPSATA